MVLPALVRPHAIHINLTLTLTLTLHLILLLILFSAGGVPADKMQALEQQVAAEAPAQIEAPSGSAKNADEIDLDEGGAPEANAPIKVLFPSFASPLLPLPHLPLSFPSLSVSCYPLLRSSSPTHLSLTASQEEEEDEDDGFELKQKAVPRAVFGSAADELDAEMKKGAKERLKKK